MVVMNEGRIRFDGTADHLLCSSVLQESGIREPLYVTALKYAGVTMISIASTALIAYIPILLVLLVLWFIVCKFF